MRIAVVGAGIAGLVASHVLSRRHQVTLFVTGSFLIEKIFDINGFGLLGFNAIIDRDFPVVMGVLMLSAFLMLLGNVISDFLMAMVDPRVRFN